MLMNNSATTSTKKKKDNTQDKVKLWNIFESEIVNPNKPNEPLECLYRNIGDRENCERCQFSLAYSEEGFLTCTNSKCERFMNKMHNLI